MKSLRNTFFGVVVLTLIFLIWTASLPEKLELKKTKQYNFTQSDLYFVISDFNNWETWFPWRDSSMKMKIDTNINLQVLKWHHQEQGKGYIKQLKLFPDSLVQLEIMFLEGNDPVFSNIRIISKNNGSTELEWVLYDDKNYEWPLGRLRAYLIKKMTGKNIEKALNDLQQIQTNTNSN